MKAKFILYILAVLLLVQCESKKQERTIEAIKTNTGAISNSEIIRNPVTANHPIDTVNVAKMEFDYKRYNYGSVVEGEIVNHTFHFTNTGKAPLIISEAKSTCGCTVPEWPKEPIPISASDSIQIRFNTDKKLHLQVKPVFITANTHPSKNSVQLIGTVIKKEKN